MRGVHQWIQGNPYPQDFSEIMPFSGNSMGKIPILSKCSAQAPLASKLSKILDLSYTVRQRCEAFLKNKQSFTTKTTKVASSLEDGESLL